MSDSVDLIVTSPPYPMISMWDGVFRAASPDISDALDREEGSLAFELMHRELDEVWREVYRVSRPGGLAAINVGDAVRTVGGSFGLFMNHVRVMAGLLSAGFTALPAIIWRKQTNSPNKFMGSGMMPPGAYVTLEHEFILMVRKGPKREFILETDKQQRRESAYFWEERNTWFSDIWLDLKGTVQEMNHGSARTRSGAFPFELAYRLINMFSIKGDMILDPFLGTGTTMAAAMASGRNSVGFEIDAGLRDSIYANLVNVKSTANHRVRDRLLKHLAFVESRITTGKDLKYRNVPYQFPVMTRQETELFLNDLETVVPAGQDAFKVSYSDKPQEIFREAKFDFR